MEYLHEFGNTPNVKTVSRKHNINGKENVYWIFAIMTPKITPTGMNC